MPAPPWKDCTKRKTADIYFYMPKSTWLHEDGSYSLMTSDHPHWWSNGWTWTWATSGTKRHTTRSTRFTTVLFGKGWSKGQHHLESNSLDPSGNWQVYLLMGRPARQLRPEAFWAALYPGLWPGGLILIHKISLLIKQGRSWTRRLKPSPTELFYPWFCWYVNLIEEDLES